MKLLLNSSGSDTSEFLINKEAQLVVADNGLPEGRYLISIFPFFVF